LLIVGVAVAVLFPGPADPGTSGAATDVAPLDQAYRFDAGGPLPLQGRAELPVEPGSIVAHWYTFRGWDVVLFEGLDLGASGPLCVGTSVLNAATHQLEHLSSSPTAAGACDSAGAGQVVLVSADRGVRACGAVVSYITGIPAETTGVLYASLTAFRGDGTGVGISSRLQTTKGPIRELDASTLRCGPLPIARAVPSPTPTPGPTVIATPAPASTGSVAAANRALPPHLTQPSQCAPLGNGGLQEVTNSAAGPYFIHRPTADDLGAPTVVFLAGGSGARSSAQRVWEVVFAGRPQTNRFQVVLPYSIDVNSIDEAPRTLAIVNEVLACYGGDPFEVHLAGTSNGGLAAFALMAAHPEYFATLLGIPGAFPVQDPATIDPAVLARTLAGRAVFNGVGARDSAWKPEVIATHNALVGAGIESVFVEFPGEGHVLSGSFDPSGLFRFWEDH
jgi:pimeloyl-ACP methyl ester carboxylesterase